nr:putative late blight resistance protein homolog R1B-16 [Ipomoea trifida]
MFEVLTLLLGQVESKCLNGDHSPTWSQILFKQPSPPIEPTSSDSSFSSHVTPVSSPAVSVSPEDPQPQSVSTSGQSDDHSMTAGVDSSPMASQSPSLPPSSSSPTVTTNIYPPPTSEPASTEPVSSSDQSQSQTGLRRSTIPRRPNPRFCTLRPMPLASLLGEFATSLMILLEELSIKGWKFNHIPCSDITWATSFLPNLKKLIYFLTSLAWSDMRLIGMLPNLEVLKLINAIASEDTMWEPSEEGFRQLKRLVIVDTYLERWNAVGDNFPVLECLELRNCYSLQEIPSGFAEITTLALIQLNWCQDSVLASAKLIQEEQYNNYGNALLVCS